MKTKILNQLLLFSFLLCAFCQLLKGQIIIDGGFENWDTINDTPLLVDWFYSPDPEENPHIIQMSNDAVEGDYSVILRGSSKGNTLVTQSISGDFLADSLHSLSLSYIMKIIENPYYHKGCIKIVLWFFYIDDLYDIRSNELFNLEHPENVNDWTKIDLVFTNLIEELRISKINLDIYGGSCDTGVHYEGNSFCYIDDVKINYKSTTEVEDITDVSSVLIIGANISSSEIQVNVPEFSEIDDLSLSVVSLQGQVVQKIDNPTENLTIDVSGLSSGMYYLHLTGNDRVLRTEKFVVD